MGWTAGFLLFLLIVLILFRFSIRDWIVRMYKAARKRS
jgi:hypothetical protein